MPALGEIPGQFLDLVAVAGREEGVEAVLVRPFPLPLDVLVERPGAAVLRRVCQLCGRIAGPPRPEELRWQSAEVGAEGGPIVHGYEEVELRLGLDPVQQL